ncbi:hypothetical protein AGLY_017400 [Aphis glycines]|uniref:Uncharacterized protein n=1 Tax=Aphis glycines TaxID=307491 RepID=A0A6G0SUS4_APHGL|nr:hypothetical protein AGLY_017400 [Aphis glycines]
MLGSNNISIIQTLRHNNVHNKINNGKNKMNYIEKWVFDQSQHTINHVQYQEPVTFIKHIKSSPEFHTLMPLNINFDKSNDILSGNIEETNFSLLDCPDKDLDYNNYMFLSDPYNCILPEKTYTINQSQMIGVTNFENNEILCSNDYHNVDNDVDIFSSVDDIEKDPDYTLERNTSAEAEIETTRVEHEMDGQEKTRSRQSRGLKRGNTDTRHIRLERKKMLGYHTQQKVVKLYNNYYNYILDMCRMKCKEKISETLQEEIFKNYWNIKNRDRRLDFLSSLIEVLPKQTSRKRKPESHCLLLFNGKWTAKTNKAIEQVLKNKYTNNSIRPIELDKTGKDSSRKYIPTHWKLAALYEEFKIKYPDVKVNRKFYETQFHDLNLAIKVPNKDTCMTCDHKPELSVALIVHQEQADLAYSMKKEDKLISKENPQHQTFTFDMQQCLPTPVITSSLAFYKRQLWTYNLTIHNCDSNQTFCDLWNETLAYRGANEVGSCLYKYLLNLP